MSGKNGSRFTIFAPTFHMHRRCGGRCKCRYDSTYADGHNAIMTRAIGVGTTVA